MIYSINKNSKNFLPPTTQKTRTLKFKVFILQTKIKLEAKKQKHQTKKFAKFMINSSFPHT